MDDAVSVQAGAVTPVAGRGVVIAIPFYRNPALVSSVVKSLMACAADIAGIGGRLILYDDSPDHPELGAALAEILPVASAMFPCRVVRNRTNMGFVRTMNLAVAEAVASGCDLLTLNSDTRVEPGALTEMARVLATDSTIGFVNPRSDNATIATLPVAESWRGLPGATQAQAFARLARQLPEVRYVPTVVGFCMLVRWDILAEFGGFDEIYGAGYNEENDLVMRASRCGYRAVQANHAFVWHDGEASFAGAAQTRDTLELANRAILDRRYPEYAGYTNSFFDQPETQAEQLLAALQPGPDGKRDIALDFSSFREDHNGTFAAGRQLLAEAPRLWGDRFNIHVICVQGVYDFHDYASLGVPRWDPHAARRFAAVFRVGQPYDWEAVKRLCRFGAVIGVYMLDTISLDCPQLFSPRLYNMWQFTLDRADLVVTQSRHTADMFARRFAAAEGALHLVAPHSLDLAAYRLPAADTIPPKTPHLLVLGNHFHHKYLSQTANALALAFPDRQVLALGQESTPAGSAPDAMAPPGLIAAPNLLGRKLGGMDEADIGAAYNQADAVIFPSHAEGFGFPLLHALAARRPVFVRPLPVFRELHDLLGGSPNVHFYRTTRQLVEALAEPPKWIDTVPPSPCAHDAAEAARSIAEALDRAMARADFGHIAARIRAVQFADDISREAAGQAQPHGKPAEAARLVASRVEAVLRRVFAVTPVYHAARLLLRAGRKVARPFRQ